MGKSKKSANPWVKRAQDWARIGSTAYGLWNHLGRPTRTPTKSIPFIPIRTTPRTKRRMGGNYTHLSRWKSSLKPFALRRKRLLSKFQVGNQVTKLSSYTSNNVLNSIAYPSKVHFAFAKEGMGLNAKGEFERIKTAEAFGNNNSLVILRQQSNYMFKNQTDVALYLTIYVLKLRVPIDSGLQAKITQCWADLGVTASGTYNVPIGCAPFLSHTFKYYFKIVATRSVVMNPGEIVDHKLTSKRIFRVNFANLNDTTHDWLKGEYVLFTKMHGGPVHDGGTNTLVGTTGGVIDIVANSRIWYRVSDASETPELANASALETTFAGGQRTFVDEDMAEDVPEA